MRSAAEELLIGIAAAVLPSEDWSHASFAQGGSHDVVLLPGIAAVRVTRSSDAYAELPRRTELLGRLAAVGLPFATPVPLAPVLDLDGRRAVAVTYIPAGPRWDRNVAPQPLRRLLDDLAAVDVTALGPLLGHPHGYAGGDRWTTLMTVDTVAALPIGWRDAARRRVDAVLALPDVPPGLVHADLAGTNVHWDGDVVVGVLDWDLAQAFDPAIDATCLGWYGWDNVRAAVSAGTYQRVEAWHGTFGLEHLARAIWLEAPNIGTVVQQTVDWLERQE